MRDLDDWMYKLAKAAVGSESNFVFVMRRTLTEAYREGFEDGHRAAFHDQFTVDNVKRINAEARAEQASADPDTPGETR